MGQREREEVSAQSLTCISCSSMACMLAYSAALARQRAAVGWGEGGEGEGAGCEEEDLRTREDDQRGGQRGLLTLRVVASDGC